MTGAVQSRFLRIMNESCQELSHLQIPLLFLVKSVSGAATREKLLVNLQKNCKSHRKLLRSVKVLGIGHSLMIFFLSSQKLKPCISNCKPKNSVSLFINSLFDLSTYNAFL